MLKNFDWHAHPFVRYSLTALLIIIVACHILRFLSPSAHAPTDIADSFVSMPQNMLADLNSLRVYFGNSVRSWSRVCSAADYQICDEIFSGISLFAGLDP